MIAFYFVRVGVALGICYAVHIDALPIKLKCISKGATRKLNEYDSVKISPLFTFTFANRGIQCDSRV